MESSAINVRAIFTLKNHDKLNYKYLQLLRLIVANKKRERRKKS